MDLFPTLTPSCRESYLAALRLIRHMGDKNTHIDILSASPFPTHNSATTHAYKYALDWQSYSPDFGVQSISTWFKRKVCRVWACLILAAYQPLHTERLSNKMLMGPERHLLNEWMNEVNKLNITWTTYVSWFIKLVNLIPLQSGWGKTLKLDIVSQNRCLWHSCFLH